MRKILLVCDCGADIGLGHLSRMRVLGHSLNSEPASNVEILIFGSLFPQQRISEFVIHHASFAEDFGSKVDKTISSGGFSAIVFDLHTSRKIGDFELLLSKLRGLGIRLIAVDSLIDFCNFFDLLWIPSFNFDVSDHTNCKCKIEYGWDCYIIQKRFETKHWTAGSKVLVLTGGSDIAKLSRALPEYLERHLLPGTEVNWVKGPFAELPRLPDSRNLIWRVHSAPSGLDELIVNSNYILTVYGVSLFEALQYGVPTVVFSPYGDKDNLELRALSAENLVSVADNASDAAHRLSTLMNDYNRASMYSSNSIKKLAMNGAENLAKQIHRLIEA